MLITPRFYKTATLLFISLVFTTFASFGEDATAFADFARYREANKSLEAKPKVVLMGNSITDNWPKLGSHLFETHPEIVGRGISGQTSYQFLLRFRQDVVALQPEIVVINSGTNDIALNGGPYDENLTFNNILTMIDIARANGIKVVLASCLPAEGFWWRPEVKDSMEKIKNLNARVKEYAHANNIIYVDYFSALLNDEGTGMREEYAYDRPAVHPNSEGYAVMEEVLLKALKAEK